MKRDNFLLRSTLHFYSPVFDRPTIASEAISLMASLCFSLIPYQSRNSTLCKPDRISALLTKKRQVRSTILSIWTPKKLRVLTRAELGANEDCWHFSSSQWHFPFFCTVETWTRHAGDCTADFAWICCCCCLYSWYFHRVHCCKRGWCQFLWTCLLNQSFLFVRHESILIHVIMHRA